MKELAIIIAMIAAVAFIDFMLFTVLGLRKD